MEIAVDFGQGTESAAFLQLDLAVPSTEGQAIAPTKQRLGHTHTVDRDASMEQVVGVAAVILQKSLVVGRKAFGVRWDLLMDAGFDFTKESFWQGGFDILKGKVERLRTLTN